jgi:hypothetical protein
MKSCEEMVRLLCSPAVIATLTYDRVVTDAIGLGPGGHHPPIIGGNHNDLVNTLRLELLTVLDVRLDVLLLACGRKGTRHGNEDHLLVLELCRWGPSVSVPEVALGAEDEDWGDGNIPLLASYLVGRPQAVRLRSPLG